MGGPRVTDGEQNQRGGAVQGPDGADRVEGDGTPAEPQRRWGGAQGESPSEDEPTQPVGAPAAQEAYSSPWSPGGPTPDTSSTAETSSPTGAVESRRASVDSRRAATAGDDHEPSAWSAGRSGGWASTSNSNPPWSPAPRRRRRPAGGPVLRRRPRPPGGPALRRRPRPSAGRATRPCPRPAGGRAHRRRRPPGLTGGRQAAWSHRPLVPGPPALLERAGLDRARGRRAVGLLRPAGVHASGDPPVADRGWPATPAVAVGGDPGRCARGPDRRRRRRRRHRIQHDDLPSSQPTGEPGAVRRGQLDPHHDPPHHDPRPPVDRSRRHRPATARRRAVRRACRRHGGVDPGRQPAQPTDPRCLQRDLWQRAAGTARLQTAVADADGNTLFSSEAVLYNANGTAGRSPSFGAVVAHCPSTPRQSPVGEPTVTTTLQMPPPTAPGRRRRRWRPGLQFRDHRPAGELLDFRRRLPPEGSGAHGSVLPGPEHPPTIGGVSTIPGVVSLFASRMAALPNSVITANVAPSNAT